MSAMRDDIEWFLHLIEQGGGWRALALNVLTLGAIGVVLYALVIGSEALR